MERYWVWDYEFRGLGTWPGDEYRGHNTPVQCITLETHQREVEGLKARVKELEERLEIDCAFDLKGNRVDAPKNLPDGIECRDETIRLQDQHVADLQAQLAEAQRDIEQRKSTDSLLATRIRETEAWNVDLKAQLAAANNERDSANRGLMYAANSFDQRVESLQAQLADAQRERDEYRNAICDVGTSLGLIMPERVRFFLIEGKAQIVALTEERDAKERMCKRYGLEIKDLRRIIDEHRALLDESGADLTQLRALVEAYEAEVERISGNGSPMTDFGKGVIAACQDMQAYLTARQAMGQATGGER